MDERQPSLTRLNNFNSSPKAVSGQGSPCPAWGVCDSSWGGAGQRPQRGRSPVEHRGICPSIRPSSHLFCQIAQIQAIWPKSKQNSPNPSIMAQIQAKWSKSSQKTPILVWGPSFWPLRPLSWPLISRFWPDLGYFAWIWAIMLGFGPVCLDLGHIA